MKILIVEDEFFIAQSIVLAIKSYNYTPLEPVDNYESALNVIKQDCPDLAILDIELFGHKTGLDLAKTIRKEHPELPFIILTGKANKETIHMAKYVNPSSILIKPFHTNGLYAAIELAFHSHNSIQLPTIDQPTKSSHTFIKEKNGLVKIMHEDILYIKSDGVYMDIKTIDQKTYTDRSSVKDYLDKLDDNFIRIHRGYIINLNHLEKIIDLSHVSIQNEYIPIGRKYKHPLFSKLEIN